MINSIGKMLKKQNYTQKTKNIKLNIKDLQTGVYFIKLLMRSGIYDSHLFIKK